MPLPGVDSAVNIIAQEPDMETIETKDATDQVYPSGRYSPLKRLLKTEYASVNADLRVTIDFIYEAGGHGVDDKLVSATETVGAY
jgi:hypothetical protein